MGSETRKFLSLTDDELHEILDRFDGQEAGKLSPEVRSVVFMMLAKVRAALGCGGIGDHAYDDGVLSKRAGDTVAIAIYRSVMRSFPGQSEETRDVSWLVAEGYPCRVRDGVVWVVFEDQSELMLSRETGFAVLQNATRYRGLTVIEGGLECAG